MVEIAHRLTWEWVLRFNKQPRSRQFGEQLTHYLFYHPAIVEHFVPANMEV